MGRNKYKLPSAFDPDQLVQLFDVIDNPKVGVAAALAFFCGLRISEACNLKQEDVDLGMKKLKVVDSKYTLRGRTGYGKDRYVPIPDQIIGPLQKWVKLIHGGKWLFPSDKSPDLPLRKKSLYEHFRHSLKQAGLEIPETEIKYTAKVDGKKVERKVTRHKYNFHTLRHSYGTYLRNKGVPLEDIKELMGHERFDTTLLYAKIAVHRKRDVVNGAFNVQLRQQVIPQEEVKRFTHPPVGQSPIEMLQTMLIKGDISEEEFTAKARAIQMTMVKRLE